MVGWLIATAWFGDSLYSRTDGYHKLGAAFACVLLMVSLHFLEGSKGGDRGQERCQHIYDLVETYGRMSGSGDRGESDEKDEDEEKDGELVRIRLTDLLLQYYTRIE